MSFNKVILMGNLTRDPETRVTASGLTISKLGLAVSRKYRDKTDNIAEETTFVDVDAFGKKAEVIQKYFAKGSKILVEGRLRLDRWESQDGTPRSKLSVVLENFSFAGSNDRSSSQDSDPSNNVTQFNGQSGNPDNAQSAPSDDVFDDDVPF